MSTRSWMRIWKGHCVTCKSMEPWISSQKWQSSVSWGSKWKTWLGLLDECSQRLVIIMLILRWSRKVTMNCLPIMFGVKIKADWSSFLHQGASEINISCVIEERDADRALNIIHTCMFTFLDWNGFFNEALLFFCTRMCGDILEFLGYPLPNFWPRRFEGMAI